MKSKLMKVFVLSLISLSITVGVFAQTAERRISAASSLYLISAKAGGVNYVSGKVAVEKDGKADGFLKKGDEIEVGDKVLSQTDGKVEILLNPGSYIRLAENSSFEFLSTSLDDLQLQVNKGSAIFEVIADKDFTVTIKMPNSKFYLISEGVFRVDVLENGEGKISVWKGKAQVGDANATIVKGGKSATQNATNVAIEKFDRDKKGEFDNWSRDRAKEIAKTNASLIQRQMRQSLLTSYNSNSWNASNGYGLWVQDPFSRTFCFLPFGWGWRSPYGFGYNQSIWNYNPPPQMVGPMYQNPNLGGNNNNNNPITVTPPSGGGNNNGGFPPSTTSPGAGGSTEPGRTRTPSENARPNIVERKANPID
ncbi:MAG: FecR domain-containing protein [Acidobacteriota bacterium]